VQAVPGIVLLFYILLVAMRSLQVHHHYVPGTLVSLPTGRLLVLVMQNAEGICHILTTRSPQCNPQTTTPNPFSIEKCRSRNCVRDVLQSTACQRHCTSRCVSYLSSSHTLSEVVVTYLRKALSGNTKDTTHT
jgi:hypothetical protein